jgi:hypothetical protein
MFVRVQYTNLSSFYCIEAHARGNLTHNLTRLMLSDVPGPGFGWALAGSGLPKPKPDPELRARPGFGLVGLRPGLMSQRGNWLKYYIKIQFCVSECTMDNHIIALTASHVRLLVLAITG